MDMHINPALLRGAVTPPPSKSMAHRLLISAALAEGTSIIHNVALSQDIEATLRCLEALGCSWERAEPACIRIHGCGPIVPTDGGMPQFDCGESGSTLRFFIPLALAIAGNGTFTGRGRLMERPQAPYFDLFDKKGIAHSMENGVLTVRGTLKSGEYRLPGDVSSQFFTGLLFALPFLGEDSVIVSSTKPESVDYIAMTVEALRAAGIRVLSQPAQRRWTVPSGRFHSFDAMVEPDWSQAAFWYAANVLGSTLRLEGLDLKSSQGDRVAAEYAAQLSQPGDVEIDVSGCPDLVPPLAVMAAARQGTCRFTNAARLRLKESDRLKTTAAMLRALGGSAEEGTDSLSVCGVSRLSGGAVDGAGDHRIVMAAAIAATRCTGSVTILGAEAVNKSYPSFFKDYLALGGDAHVI